jgi:hypothetical protein
MIRARYPSLSKFAPRGDDFCGEAALPIRTEALPATPAKVHILIERARQRQSLWHPRDARRSLN